MKVKFVPEVCEKEDAKIKGHLIVRAPTAAERMKYMRDAGIVSAAKSVNDSGDMEISSDSMLAMEKLLSFVPDHIEEVCLKAENGFEFNKESLLVDSECTDILVEIAKKLMAGFSPSKNFVA